MELTGFHKDSDIFTFDGWKNIAEIKSGDKLATLNPYTRIAEFFGVGRGVDIIVYISLALLFYLVFRIYVMIEDLRHQMTDIIREIALSGSSKIRKNRKRSKK